MKTINFCGDSFCKEEAGKAAWTYLLSDMLQATIIGFGQGGSAHEHAIKSFDEQADYTIFCWTEPHRLYVNDRYSINFSTIEYNYKLDKKLNQRDTAAYAYYRCLHNSKLDIDRQTRDLYWFDNVVLSRYSGVAIHIPCFDTIYQFTNGINIKDILGHKRLVHKLQNGDKSTEYANHLTEQQNFELADKIYNIIKG